MNHTGGNPCQLRRKAPVDGDCVLNEPSTTASVMNTGDNGTATTAFNAGRIRTVMPRSTAAPVGRPYVSRISGNTRCVSPVCGRTESSEPTPSITKFPSDRVETPGIGTTSWPWTPAATAGSRHWRGAAGDANNVSFITYRCYLNNAMTGRGTCISRNPKALSGESAMCVRPRVEWRGDGGESRDDRESEMQQMWRCAAGEDDYDRAPAVLLLGSVPSSCRNATTTQATRGWPFDKTCLTTSNRNPTRRQHFLSRLGPAD